MASLPPVGPRDILTLSVGSLAAPVEPMYPEDSLRAVSRELTAQGLPVVPIAEGNRLVGTVSEAEVVFAMSRGESPDVAVSEVMEKLPPTLLSNSSGAEALRYFDASGSDWAIVVDTVGQVVGVLTPSRLLDPHENRALLGRVGGMATPFGVYLTNGVVSGGVSGWAVLATGATMFGMFAIAGVPVLWILNNTPLSIQRAAWFETALNLLWIVLFLLCLRILPLSGTHGAEHMVVHALERGEELKPAIIRRMPRVHPRCGTNLAVGGMLFLGIMSWDVIREPVLRLLVAAIATLAFWQPLGSFLQYFVTTKRPNDRQLQSGIRAGEHLLLRISQGRVVRPTLVQKLAMSGLFQVIVGSTLAAALLSLAYQLLHVPDAWRLI